MTEEEKRLQQQQNNTPAPEVKQPTQPAPQTNDVYTQTMNTLKANSKPVYSATYDAQIRDVYDQIVNRDKFTYDINADALYQQYKDQYVNLGKMAMKDTMGQAAALTGGYGSSYGQSVGQQQYDAYLQRLNEVVPQLYGQAYTAYRDEGDALMQQYAMLGDMADDEYAKYNDAYNKYFAELDYNKTQLMDMINSTGYVPTPQEIEAAGMTQEQVDLILNTWRLQNPDLAYKNGTITPEQYKQLTGKYPSGYRTGRGGGGGDPAIRALQQELKDKGLYEGEVDGIDGELTQAAREKAGYVMDYGSDFYNDPVYSEFNQNDWVDYFTGLRVTYGEEAATDALQHLAGLGKVPHKDRAAAATAAHGKEDYYITGLGGKK